MSDDVYYKARKIAEAFVNHEIEDYGWGITKVENHGADSDSCQLELTIDDKYYVVLRISEMPDVTDEDDEEFFSDAKIEVEMGEDYFEETKDYDWTIKYFWIALLDNS